MTSETPITDRIPIPQNVSLSLVVPARIVGGKVATGTVTVHVPPPQLEGTFEIKLSSNHSEIVTLIPDRVTIILREGNTANFEVQTKSVTEELPVTITAEVLGSVPPVIASAGLAVLPLLDSVTVTPGEIRLGDSASGEVKLNDGAPPSMNNRINLSSTHPQIVHLSPNPLPIEAGATSAPFKVETGHFPPTDVAGGPGSPTGPTFIVTITAEFLGTKRSHTLTINTSPTVPV
jgi:hypothetical protein